MRRVTSRANEDRENSKENERETSIENERETGRENEERETGRE